MKRAAILLCLLLLTGCGSDAVPAIETNDRQYAGSYRLEQSDAGSAVYTVTVGQTEGMAVTALTRYADGSSRPTLILTLDGYALHFFPQDDQA